MDLAYSINGVTFQSLGIYVRDSDGVLDGLSLKEPFAVDWPEAHGEVVDLLRPRYQPRQISLDCWMVAPSSDAFVTQITTLKTQLFKSGTQRLRVNPISGKPLVYEVYCKSGFSVKKKWRDGMMVGEFTLNLTEPQPVKKVYRASGGQTASLTLTAGSPINVHWGDGTKIDVMGTKTVSHSYSGTSSVQYYLILAGELERMTLSSTASLTEIWPRLY